MFCWTWPVAKVSVSELKEQTSRVLQRVREKGEHIEITYYGEPIARLVPIRPARPSEEELAAYWAEWEQLAAEIGKKWPEGVSAVVGVREFRREL